MTWIEWICDKRCAAVFMKICGRCMGGYYGNDVMDCRACGKQMDKDIKNGVWMKHIERRVV